MFQEKELFNLKGPSGHPVWLNDEDCLLDGVVQVGNDSDVDTFAGRDESQFGVSVPHGGFVVKPCGKVSRYKALVRQSNPFVDVVQDWNRAVLQFKRRRVHYWSFPEALNSGMLKQKNGNRNLMQRLYSTNFRYQFYRFTLYLPFHCRLKEIYGCQPQNPDGIQNQFQNWSTWQNSSSKMNKLKPQQTWPVPSIYITRPIHDVLI